MEVNDWNGTRIKDLRKGLGLTQAELALRIKVSVDTLRSYEHNDRRPSLAVQRRLNRQASNLKKA